MMFGGLAWRLTLKIQDFTFKNKCFLLQLMLHGAIYKATCPSMVTAWGLKGVFVKHVPLCNELFYLHGFLPVNKVAKINF